ncbi:MAG: flagellar assembly protein FliH [Pseudomonadota bacterium]
MEPTNFIPKEELNSYQRWEMESLDMDDENDKNDKDQEVEAASNVPVVDEPPEIRLPTEEQVAAIYQQAKESGYTEGYQAGHSNGYEEARKIAETEVKAELAHLQAILSNLDQELLQIDQSVAQDLLALSLELSKKMVMQALKIKPELILPVVQEAIRHLPSSMQHPHLFLHPDDAALVRLHLQDHLSQDNWIVREDEQLSRGGCRIKTNGSEIDASPETRWQRILATIGQDNNWLVTGDSDVTS